MNERWKTHRNNGKDCGFGGNCRIVWDESRGLDVCYVTPCSDADNGNSTALLIAAAPDLYDACMAVLASDASATEKCMRATAKAKHGVNFRADGESIDFQG